MNLFSILILTYNSPLEKIKRTINSVLVQDLKDYEIIISDDGSSVTFFEEIRDYFKKAGFSNYTIIENKVNVGTTKNFIIALENASGFYIKGVGPGDMLYDPSTLSHLYHYMNSNPCKLAFGLINSFTNSSDQYVLHDFHSPIVINEYSKKEPNSRRILRDIMYFGNMISGCNLFAERDFILDLCRRTAGIVKYCEDLMQIFAFIDGCKIGYLPEPILWYEYGSGISKKSNTYNLIQKDFDDFYRYLGSTYGKNKIIMKGIRLRNLNLIKMRSIRIIVKTIYAPQIIPFFIKKLYNERTCKADNSQEKYEALLNMLSVNIF